MSKKRKFVGSGYMACDNSPRYKRGNVAWDVEWGYITYTGKKWRAATEKEISQL